MPSKNRTAMVLGEKFQKLAKNMAQFHKVGSVSEYVRGLILVDALIATGGAGGVPTHEIPAWIFLEYPVAYIRWTREQWKEWHDALEAKAKEGATLTDLINLGSKWETLANAAEKKSGRK